LAFAAPDDSSCFRLLARWPPTESADQLIGLLVSPSCSPEETADVMDSVRLVAVPIPSGALAHGTGRLPGCVRRPPACGRSTSTAT
jgi:hypothetical protein